MRYFKALDLRRYVGTQRRARICILFAMLVQCVMCAPAYAISSQCTLAFNRVTALTNQGEASLCRNQQQMLDALDAAASACSGQNSGVNFGAIKSEFLANASRCAIDGSAQGIGSSHQTPSDGNAALNNARANGDRADQYLKDMEKCDQIADPGRRSACSYATTRAYRGDGSGPGANPNGSISGQVGASSSPDDNANQQRKPLPPPPKDPGIDYTGQSCSYFTRPPMEDEGRMNYYAKGSCVSYGQSSYECGSDGRWLRKGSAEVVRCIPAEEAETSSGAPIREWYIKKK